ncbi:AAA family ATPase, partial [bacterium]|nr:AAA family ATPase [bacterium]
MPDNTDAIYEEFSELRDRTTLEVLNSDSEKKIIIAGPGTGKSYLFQEVCKKLISQNHTNILTLSFINELVDDLAVDLFNLAEVRTLHSLALSLLPTNSKMFLELESVIADDYYILNDAEINYKYLLCNLLNEPEKLEFYSSRRRYYNYFSPNCSVYTLVKYFEADSNRIPTYSQLLIDEYQDFNILEAKLLTQLMTKSPVLIVGDDDQSLYDFKNAIPDDIRNKASSDEFTTFKLPYCSRCTKVAIDAYNKLVQVSQEKGFLQRRYPKDFQYFPSKNKDYISNTYDKIGIKKGVFTNTLAYQIDSQIKAMVNPKDEKLPSILIICPLRRQIIELERALSQKGYRNIDASERHAEDILLSGANLIIDDSRCNLGWRILFKDACVKAGMEERYQEVLSASTESQDSFLNLLTVDERRPIKRVVSILRKIRKGNDIIDEEFSIATKFLNIDPSILAMSKMRSILDQSRISRNIFRDIPIKIVTILGSKGLTRDVSFLVNFDDRYLLERDGQNLIPSDTKICGFLVSLTR